MRRHILAALGAPASRGRAAGVARRCGLAPLHEGGSLHLYCSPDLPSRSLEDGSIVVGDCFAPCGSGPGRPDEGWGNYLAFGASGRSATIERAPLTGLPLYWTRQDEGVLCSTSLEILSELGCGLAVDEAFVGNSLAYPNLRTERTGVSGLNELLSGSRLGWTGTSATTTEAWSPWNYIAPQPAVSVDDLARQLEAVIIDCTRAWCAGRPEILLELSGGLDSSIVAAALDAAGADFSAINFATAAADGDERGFAAAVSAQFGRELLEVLNDEATIDLVGMPNTVRPRPGAYGVLGGLDLAFEQAVGARSVAIFGGIGGDNVFDFDTSVAPVIDALQACGVSGTSFAALRNVAQASEATLWQAARLSWRAWRDGPRSPWVRETQFCRNEAMPEQPLPHPWDDAPEITPRGKRKHVAAIRRILDFLDRPERWTGRDVIAPLLSQPVVELCLSIPSWTWFTGGRDRAIARQAFARRLPASIIWRKGKGRLESACSAAYLRQRPALRGLLLDGRLAALGFLNRAAIEAYLARDGISGDHDYFRLLEIADIERWLRSLESASRAARMAAQR
ncbi:arginine N-succinyltransferase [Sphingopyxis macrogoltabida]|nr:arginine N-succinyltransferase [Sphingopyxis macrogoltabida]